MTFFDDHPPSAHIFAVFLLFVIDPLFVVHPPLRTKSITWCCATYVTCATCATPVHSHSTATPVHRHTDSGLSQVHRLLADYLLSQLCHVIRSRAPDR